MQHMHESHGAIAESDIADTNGADCENYKKGLGNLTMPIKPLIVASNDFSS